MIAEFSIVPFGKEESVSKYVAKIVSIVKNSGLAFQLNPMGTVIEGAPEQVFQLIQKCHLEMKTVSNRVLTRISIDDRGDDLNRMNKKVQSVESKMNS